MCIREIDQIGKSKKVARDKKIKAIHSHKTKSEVRKISKQFANYVRSEFDIKKLHNVTQEHYKSFLDSKSHTSLDYRRSIETHLRLLQKGLNKRSERFSKEQVQFVTEKRLIPSKNRNEGIRNRSLSLRDINIIKSNVSSQNVLNSINLMHNLGLRVSGSVSVKVGDVNFENGTLAVTEKGGRTRSVPIPGKFKSGLADMVQGKEADDRIVPMTATSVSNEIKRAAKAQNVTAYSGTHAFRHTYARNQVNRLMTPEEKQLFNRCLEQYKQGKGFDYGVHNQALYDSMKSKMDQVHAWIGHGENRFDLASRYMS